MRIINKTMMYVHPESRPQERQLASGLWVPEAGVGIAKGLDVERREGEWWPTNATVVECAAGGIEDGTELTGEDVINYQTLQTIHLEKPRKRPSWRTPKRGDVCHFSAKSLNPNTFDKGGNTFVPITTAYCATSPDGERWAIGPWAIVEQLPEMPESNGLITTVKTKSVLGRAIVRMVGDGFAEDQPRITPGMVVSFMVSGSNNPVFPNPDGRDPLTAIKAHMVIGVSREVLPEDEFQKMKQAVRDHEAEVSKMIASAGINEAMKVPTEKQLADSRFDEQEQEHFAAARKERDKSWVRTNQRIKH